MLHAGRRERGKADHVARGVDVLDVGLVVLVDVEPLAVVELDADLVEPERPAHALPADGVEQRLGPQRLARLELRLHQLVEHAVLDFDFLDLADLLAEPQRDAASAA